jgi:hypothetical protein
MSADHPSSILRLKSELERTGLSRSTLYRKVMPGPSPSRSASRSAAPDGGLARSKPGIALVPEPVIEGFIVGIALIIAVSSRPSEPW